MDKAETKGTGTEVYKELGFEKELEQLINKYSIENESNTPDFILASYLRDCLNAFNKITKERDKWWGVTPRIGNKHLID